MGKKDTACWFRACELRPDRREEVQLEAVDVRKKRLAVVAAGMVAGTLACLFIAVPPRVPFHFLRGFDRWSSLPEPTSRGTMSYEGFKLEAPEGEVIKACRAELVPAGFREEPTDRGKMWRSEAVTVALVSTRGVVYVTVGRKATPLDHIRHIYRKAAGSMEVRR